MAGGQITALTKEDYVPDRIDKIRTLVQKPQIGVNFQDYGGATPLWRAVSWGRFYVVRMLLGIKADPNACNFSNLSALWIADARFLAFQNEPHQQYEMIIEILLEHGATPYTVNPPNKFFKNDGNGFIVYTKKPELTKAFKPYS